MAQGAGAPDRTGHRPGRPDQQPRKRLNSETIARLWTLFSYLPARRLRGLWLLLGLSVLIGVLDLVFVGLLARLVGTLSGARLADKIPNIFVFGGDAINQGFWVAGILIALVWLATTIKLAALGLQGWLTAQIWSDYGERIYGNVLLQPYDYFQGQTTAHLLARLNRIFGRISDSIVLPLLTAVSNGVSAAVLSVGVIVAFGWQAFLIFAFLLLAYSFASVLITPMLRFATRQKLIFSLNINTLLMESTRSIRDVQLYGAEPHFQASFRRIGQRGKTFDRISKTLPEVPRYIVEPAGITVLFLVGLLPSFLSSDPVDSVRDAIPTLAAIMFAGLRLSAPIQAIFRSVNKLRGGLPDIEDALTLLRLRPGRITMASEEVPSPAGVMPNRQIRLEGVGYRYPQSDRWVLDDVDLSVPVGSRIAFVGRTGGGKSTAAHVLLGLLTPQRGSLLLDGIPLKPEELPAWQACCAIVPQNIVLLNASVRDNVAFGINDDAIDDARVWEALEMAQLADFVSELPYGVYTVVGEDGMRLSGGQRQRLALARAFYKQARVLILDEATSALDNKTESDVLEALELVGRRCTTIVVAHRLSTIRYCDRIYEFDGGRIKASGDYRALQGASESFRELVALQDG
ncbi:ABC transporter ATP-binding protein [Synechococcus sp. RSCCF101]|uniref:ABC transporter ATP-binding protein n=1 Tax=Synechococcus sp. RSCCF101 TaxID=2511069 RepID=UPI001247ACBB|nr:ABC transporter ATP-binding protein [Synechococcus sp. RSCCF101]QEY32441.1 ABC transporter ATP-binding protein [Synechococcus sp. RSCCF101]